MDEARALVGKLVIPITACVAVVGVSVWAGTISAGGGTPPPRDHYTVGDYQLNDDEYARHKAVRLRIDRMRGAEVRLSDDDVHWFVGVLDQDGGHHWVTREQAIMLSDPILELRHRSSLGDDGSVLSAGQAQRIRNALVEVLLRDPCIRMRAQVAEVANANESLGLQDQPGFGPGATVLDFYRANDHMMLEVPCEL